MYDKGEQTSRWKSLTQTRPVGTLVTSRSPASRRSAETDDFRICHLAAAAGFTRVTRRVAREPLRSPEQVGQLARELAPPPTATASPTLTECVDVVRGCGGEVEETGATLAKRLARKKRRDKGQQGRHREGGDWLVEPGRQNRT
ncbi:unnamed protein product [Pleuronectes platessa]|uniref:Uncharacterized protein n=1 Tax=Pleuronectes platessa TaxID=8262 RepID=A0A9N7YHZ5_PLEPL|nr:unnamed protein product [Pleuronectes platessa]